MLICCYFLQQHHCFAPIKTLNWKRSKPVGYTRWFSHPAKCCSWSFDHSTLSHLFLPSSIIVHSFFLMIKSILQQGIIFRSALFSFVYPILMSVSHSSVDAVRAQSEHIKFKAFHHWIISVFDPLSPLLPLKSLCSSTPRWLETARDNAFWGGYVLFLFILLLIFLLLLFCEWELCDRERGEGRRFCAFCEVEFLHFPRFTIRFSDAFHFLCIDFQYSNHRPRTNQNISNPGSFELSMKHTWNSLAPTF